MPQISNLKLFFSTTNHTFSPGFPLKPNLLHPLFVKPKILQKPFSVVSFSARRGVPKIPPWRKNSSTLRDTKKSKEKAEVMEETKGSAGFNKRRAEGNDKNDKFKNLQLKVRKLNPINTISYVQILGTGMDTQDTSPSILLFFDKQRFIFNAGEGLQRYCTEHKIKLSKVDHIFLSRVCSETAGGLPGLLLTLAGMGDEGMSVKLSGPSDLKYLVKAMRSFIPNAAMLHTESFGPTLNAGGDISDLEKFMEPQVLVNDEVVKISAILIRPRYPVLNDNPSIFISSDEEKDQCSLPPLNHSRTSKNIDEAVLKPGDLSVIYVCELPEIKGKFDPAKAADLGLRPGPKYRELQLGKSVKSDRQNIMVHPSDVLGPSIPGPTVLLIDCPTLSHLEDLLSKQSLSCYYTDSVNDKPENKSVNCIIHLSPSSVTMTATYQSWMKKFDGAQHIMAGHEKKNIEIPILKSSARVAARLNYLCPQFFPSPGFWCLQHLRDLAPDLSEAPIAKPCDSISAENLLKFHLRPYAQLGLDRSGIPSLMSSPEVVNELLLEIPEIADSMEQVNQLWNETIEAKSEKYYTQESIVMTEEPWSNGEYASIEDRSTSASWEVKGECDLPSCLENITREDMEFVLLGTGSSQPSKYRNVSSIYVNLFSNGGLLLDCGEGSLGQLKRRFGVKGADDAIRSLKCIWISHIHADHHTGLARILSHRRELLRGSSLEPLLVIGPRPLQRFLDAYQMLEDLDMQFVDCRHTTEAALASFASILESSERHSSTGSPSADDKPNKKNIETSLFAKGSRMESYWKRPSSPVDTAMSFKVLNTLKKVLKETGLESLISVPVVHCPQAYAVVLKAAERTNTAGKTIPGWKLVYSGDTRPCPALVDASHGATVLIHEATFEDGLVEEAIARNHSTTKEAIEVGDSAGAYRIILTHFSQRYPKIPIFDETHMHKTCIGFDLMSVNVADLPVLPKVLPHLQLLFKNEMIADEIDDTLGPLLEQ